MSNAADMLVVFATRNSPAKVGVSTAYAAAGQSMRKVLDQATKQRNWKQTRSRDDWYCLCVAHGFSKKFGPAALRQELVSISAGASLSPEHCVLAKLEKALHRNRTKCRQVELIF